MRMLSKDRLSAFLVASTAASPICLAFSGHSSFWGSKTAPPSTIPTSSASLVMYENSHDPPSSPKFNAWHVLSNTEAWLSKTLDSANTAFTGANPYTRKEVSYQCEPATTGPMIAANLFRRLKEARELGQAHGAEQQDYAKPSTLRQTQVIVIPGHESLSENFPAFDRFVNAVNQARRNARDYVVSSPDDDDDDDDAAMPWSVAVNCAHLHPKFGEKNAQQRLQELKDEEEAGEVDLNYKQYQELKNKARQSPYPTIVIEVRATPPPDFGTSPPISIDSAPDRQEQQVSAQDIQKLEALFGKSAHMTQENSEDAFYEAVAQSINNPLDAAQEWIASHDPAVDLAAAFTESDTTHVDEAYQFVFTNVAMMMEDVIPGSDSSASRHRKFYLVFPNFLTTAATSYEKFTMEAQHMLSALPDVGKKVNLTTFHPEHVDPEKRAPYTILAMEWKDQ